MLLGQGRSLAAAPWAVLVPVLDIMEHVMGRTIVC